MGPIPAVLNAPVLAAVGLSDLSVSFRRGRLLADQETVRIALEASVGVFWLTNNQTFCRSGRDGGDGYPQQHLWCLPVGSTSRSQLVTEALPHSPEED